MIKEEYSKEQLASIAMMASRLRSLCEHQRTTHEVFVTGPWLVLGEWTHTVYAEGRTYPEAFRLAQLACPSRKVKETQQRGRKRLIEPDIYPEPVRVLRVRGMR